MMIKLISKCGECDFYQVDYGPLITCRYCKLGDMSVGSPSTIDEDCPLRGSPVTFQLSKTADKETR